MKKLLVLLLLARAADAAAPTPTRLDKMAALLRAEEQRDAARALDLLRDADAGVRRRAALALGRIGQASSAGPLADRVGDGVVEVRRMAAFASGLLGDASAEARLAAALDDVDAEVRARAAQALGRLRARGRAPAVAAAVLRAVPKGMAPISVRGDDPGQAADPWLELRLGLLALGELGDPASAARLLLDGAQSRFDWWAAVEAAALLAAADELEPVLLTGAISSDPRARAAAAPALAVRRTPAAREALLKLVRDREDAVATAALRALGASGDAAVAEVVLAATREPSAARRRAALDALAALPPRPIPREEIVGLVGHDDPGVRAAALRLLARSDRDELTLVLSGLDRDPVWSVRAAVAQGLAGIREERAHAILFGMLKDPDARLVAAALDAVRISQGPDAQLVLTQHLSHADLAVRLVAARGLTALAEKGGAMPARELVEAYRLSRHDVDPEARLAIVGALARAGDAARDALRGATEDPDLAVRAAAAGALGGSTMPPAGPERSRPWLDYARAMAPYAPQPDRPLYTPRAFLHTRRGVVEIHLNTVEAPVAVETFVSLARRGFFNGLAFHRVVPGERVEGGCPREDGLGGPGFRIPREAGTRAFGRGAVGLDARAKDTEGSRFFITLAAQPSMDGRATLLGTVVTGIEVVEQLREDDVIHWVEIWDGR